MTIQNILNLVDSFKILLMNEYDAVRLYHFKQIFIASNKFNDIVNNYSPADYSPTKLVWCNEFVIQLNELLAFLI
ncbi:unnamed protein product [Heterobilharzia americana]|nr:unnamed protein product [Heterobilharzia americana]